MDRVRRLFVAFVVLIVGALVVLVVAVRPGLRDDADAVDATWKPLVAPLDTRYTALRAVADAFAQSSVGKGIFADELRGELDKWTVARTGTDAAAQVDIANRLEALGARARAIAATPRLAKDLPLQLALKSFDDKRPAGTALDEYTREAMAYQRERDGFWSRIVARLDGYPMRPTLQLAPAIRSRPS